MPVPAHSRETSELVVLTKVTELFKYAVQLSKNEKVMSKKNRRLVAEPLLDSVRALMYDITAANNLYAKDPEEFELRKRLQLAAFVKLNHVIVDVKFCMAFAQDSADVRFAKLLDMVDDAKITLKAWIKSDKKASRKKEEDLK